MQDLERDGGTAGPEAARPRIVVVGAGFGGLAAVKALADAPVDIVLIDRRNHHLFQPLLYQVATAALSPADIAAPIRSILRHQRNVTVLLDEVTGVDTERREVLTRDNAQTRYDWLILASGSAYSYFGHEQEWAPLAPGVKTLDDAVAIRSRVLLAFERAETENDPAKRARLLTFVLVGAGPTGVEMAGSLAELARAALARDFRSIDPRAARILLVEAGPKVLSGFPDELGRYACRALEGMGVDVLLEAPLEAVDRDGVVVKGEPIPAATVIWCAGVKASPVGKWLGVPTEKGGAVKVGPDLSVPGHPQVFVIGDAAFVPRPGDGRPLPGIAPVAKQQGNHVARVLRSKLAGSAAPAAFDYRDRGMLATIGRSAAIVDFGGLKLTGLTGWLLWGFAHIYFLIGFRNRAAVFLNWAWSWLTYARGARLITGAEAVTYTAGPEGAPGRRPGAT